MDTLLVNKANVCGIVMRLPEFDYMPDGTLIARIIVTTTEHWIEHDDEYECREVKHHETHELLAYGRLANVAANYIKEWSKIYAEGVMRDMYVIQDIEAYRQNPRTSVVLIATDLQFLGLIPEPILERPSDPFKTTKLHEYCYRRHSIPASVWGDHECRRSNKTQICTLDEEFSF